MISKSVFAGDFEYHGCLFLLLLIDVINVYNVYKKFFVNAFIILSTFISIKNHVSETKQ